MWSSRSRIHGCANVTAAALAMLMLSSCGESTTSIVVGSGPTTSVVPSQSSTAATSTTGPPPPTTSNGAPPTRGAPDTTDTEETMPSTSEPNVPDAVIAGDLVQAAIADLVERVDAEPDAIDVVTVDEVDWPDGSIGCPQPGMVYTQAIVNGTRIVLRFEGTDYPYHQGGDRPVFYCPSGATRAASAPPRTDLDL